MSVARCSSCLDDSRVGRRDQTDDGWAHQFHPRMTQASLGNVTFEIGVRQVFDGFSWLMMGRGPWRHQQHPSGLSQTPKKKKPQNSLKSRMKTTKYIYNIYSLCLYVYIHISEKEELLMLNQWIPPFGPGAFRWWKKKTNFMEGNQVAWRHWVMSFFSSSVILYTQETLSFTFGRRQGDVTHWSRTFHATVDFHSLAFVTKFDDRPFSIHQSAGWDCDGSSNQSRLKRIVRH